MKEFHITQEFYRNRTVLMGFRHTFHDKEGYSVNIIGQQLYLILCMQISRHRARKLMLLLMPL